MTDYPLSNINDKANNGADAGTASHGIAKEASADALSPAERDRLVEEHLASVYRYAYRLTGQVADAEDLTQQTFLIAQTRIDQLRDPERERAWLLTVLRRCFLKNCRRKKESLAGDLEIDLEYLPSEQAAETFDQETLQAALNELPAEFRLVVLMFYFEHQSYKDIAATLELPIGTVMSRLSRAKTILRRRLFSETVEVSSGGSSQNTSNNGSE